MNFPEQRGRIILFYLGLFNKKYLSAIFFSPRMTAMRFFSPARYGLVLSCFLLSGISLPAEKESGIALESVLKEAQERSRREALLAIERDLRAIYASLAEPGIPDLERSRRLAPIAARYENHLKRYRHYVCIFIF